MVMEEYEELKKNLKKAMSNACEQVNADQLKWETPNGTKITFSKGHFSEIEKEKDAKEAILDYSVIKNFKYNGKEYSLVNVDLKTGRLQ